MTRLTPTAQAALWCAEGNIAEAREQLEYELLNARKNHHRLLLRCCPDWRGERQWKIRKLECAVQQLREKGEG